MPPAVIGLRACSLPLKGGGMATARLTTEGLLVDVPLPDFSMPFNVITLVSTLIAFFFGSMLNVVVRKGKRREEGKGRKEGGGVVGRIRRKLRALMAWLRGGGGVG